MDKLKMQSPNLVDANIDKIAALFPNCITEDRDEHGTVRRAVDFDLLRQELSASLVEGPQERYTLNWVGKNEAILAANAPIAKTLRPCEEESVDFENTRNIFIEGDNLDALKLLQETYLNKVKMIYIDPPYNTGKDFIYKDNFKTNKAEYEETTGQRDEEGGRLVANLESNGRFHSDWLCMMFARLKLSRTILREDGFIFISIDDHEAARLKQICDEIFGEANFVAQFIWNTEGHTDNQYDVKVNHEYILLYAKSVESLLGYVVDPNTREESNLWKGFAENSITKNGSANPPSEVTLPAGFPCVVLELDLEPNCPEQAFFTQVQTIGYITRQITDDYDISYPIRLDRLCVADSKLIEPCRVFSGWANVDKLRQFISGGCNPIDEGNGNILTFYLSAKGVVYYRRDREKAKNIVSVLRNMGTTEQMRSELERIGIPFQYPKPKQLISYLLSIGVDQGGIVLDFFAGSCTTAHSIFELCSKADGPPINFIMVQFPEPLNPNDAKQLTGFEFCTKHDFPTNISEIGKERIRRVGKIIKEETGIGAKNLDTGFRVFKIDTSNLKDIYYTPDELKQLDLFADHIKPDRRPEDLLFQVFIDWGLDLSLPIVKETIDGKTIFLVDGNALIACFDPGINEELVKKLAIHKPLRVVFRDDSFASDSVKINVEQIFKQLSPGTEVKSI